MSVDNVWCQNPKCPEKKNSNQIRGSKGKKYFQSNKANGYGNGNFCTQGCADTWCAMFMDRAINALGIRINEPIKVDMENSWEVDMTYQNRSFNDDGRYIYFLVNKLHNVRHPITIEQALSSPPRNGSYWEYRSTIPSAKAEELAKQLGLTQQ